MADRYDVVIVGAGPAGAMAAYQLGRAGCRVLVIERERLPRYKPCAGAIADNVLSALPAPCAEAVERRVTRVRFQLGTEEEAEHELYGTPIAMVDRARFDYALLSQASCTVHDGERVVAVEDGPAQVAVRTTNGGCYGARYAIGADGTFSTVARSLGLGRPAPLWLALEAEVPVGSELLRPYAEAALFLIGTVPGGYVWVFPKGDHLSFGLGAYGASGPALRLALLEAALQLGMPVEAVRPRGYALPMGGRQRPLQQGRILLAGDAAALVDPLSGEGIRHALHSGRLAAEAILREDTTGYSQRVQAEIGNHLRVGRHIARLFYRFPRQCFRLGARNPAAVAALARTLRGEVTYGQMLRRLPGYLIRHLWRRR